MRTVGILGGMGPEATILLMQKVLARVRASDDADHIPLIVHQKPQVPSRIRHLIERNGEDPGPVLAQMARELEGAGAEALAMPCNTAHAYADQIRAAIRLPFLDMVEATARRLPVGRIGMLASPAVRLAGVMERAFAARDLRPVFLPDDAPLLGLIRRIKAGERSAALDGAFRDLAERLLGSSDHLLVACTEFSTITPALDGLGWTDSLDCLVEEIAAFAQSDPR